jgi:hypothetical protein
MPRGFSTQSANSSLAVVRQPNGWTEVTLPDAESDDRNRLGPNLPVRYLAVAATPLRSKASLDHGWGDGLGGQDTWCGNYLGLEFGLRL